MLVLGGLRNDEKDMLLGENGLCVKRTSPKRLGGRGHFGVGGLYIRSEKGTKWRTKSKIEGWRKRGQGKKRQVCLRKVGGEGVVKGITGAGQ